jgi:2-hydroxychromene-2-carboxylate isomerase
VRLYYDLASPYAYLAVHRADRVLGEPPELRPVLVGAIFQWRGRGSWALTDQRDAGEAEVERRAARYGLPPIVWPDRWPVNSLAPMRAAVVAGRQGRSHAFARAAFEREFAHGEDISDVVLLDEIGRSVGVDNLREAIADPEVKRALREATEQAWELGVRGVPTLEAGRARRGRDAPPHGGAPSPRRLFFGDDRLEEAAAATRG